MSEKKKIKLCEAMSKSKVLYQIEKPEEINI